VAGLHCFAPQTKLWRLSAVWLWFCRYMNCICVGDLGSEFYVGVPGKALQR
jgi:hypothetical protein